MNTWQAIRQEDGSFLLVELYWDGSKTNKSVIVNKKQWRLLRLCRFLARFRLTYPLAVLMWRGQQVWVIWDPPAQEHQVRWYESVGATEEDEPAQEHVDVPTPGTQSWDELKTEADYGD